MLYIRPVIMIRVVERRPKRGKKNRAGDFGRQKGKYQTLTSSPIIWGRHEKEQDMAQLLDQDSRT